VIFDLYYHDILTLHSLVFILSGVIIIIAAGIFLYRLRIAIRLRQFAVFFAVISPIFIFAPSHVWLVIFCVITTLFLTEGIALGIICRFTGLPSLSLSYQYSPKIAFVGVSDNLIIHMISPQSTFRSCFSLALYRYALFEITGTDSLHCEIAHPKKGTTSMPFFFSRGTSPHQIPVMFTLRGFDSGSMVYASLSFQLPWSFICPWRYRIRMPLPDIPVLSSTFAPLAGKVVLSRIDDRMKRRATRMESRLRTDAFLHLGPYTAGEPISQIDFRASMRSNDIISKKFAHTIDLTCLVALGFGRRAYASGTGEILAASLGRILSENVSMGIGSEVIIFDTATRIRERLRTSSPDMLRFGQDLAGIHPTHLEEDEFCILDGIGRSIRDYTHLRILVAWGGSFDQSRAIYAASLFKKNGVLCEIQVVAPEVLSIIDEKKESDTSRFFKKLMDQYTASARSAGITLSWVKF
jgi:hypothetical protein